MIFYIFRFLTWFCQNKWLPSFFLIFWNKLVILGLKLVLEKNVELKKAWRSQSLLEFKRFKEESVAISSFLSVNKKYLFCKLSSGYQSFDATLLSIEGFRTVEVVTSGDGHLNAKINQHLDQFGYAPLTLEDPNSFKSKRKFEEIKHADAIDVSLTLNRDAEEIVKVIQMKNSKRYSKDFILIVNVRHQCGPWELVEVFEKVAIWSKDQILNFEEVWLVEPWTNKLFQIKYEGDEG